MASLLARKPKLSFANFCRAMDQDTSSSSSQPGRQTPGKPAAWGTFKTTFTKTHAARLTGKRPASNTRRVHVQGTFNKRWQRENRRAREVWYCYGIDIDCSGVRLQDNEGLKHADVKLGAFGLLSSTIVLLHLSMPVSSAPHTCSYIFHYHAGVTYKVTDLQPNSKAFDWASAIHESARYVLISHQPQG